MDSDYKFQCPRPRNVRACAHCRAKRTRCLRELPYAPCRRCQALHLQCQLDSRVAPIKATCPVAPKTEEVDVVSGLFGAPQKPPPADNVVSFHHRIFQEKFANCDEPSADKLPREPDGTGARAPVLDQKTADELVERFRAKSSYFPFVTVPDDIATPQHRFLYLAILTVTATDNMALMRSLDARFRAVLADRVVVAGEKSLDYLQGLLVYISWDNMHLRPTNFLVYQYFHIAIGMVTELRYNDDSFPLADQTPSTIANIKNACLGCYYLSSRLSTHTRRPNIAVLSENLKSYLFELSQSDSLQAQMISRSMYIQMNVEAAHRGEGIMHEVTPNASLDTPAIKIAHLFLAFFRESTARSDPSDTAYLQAIVMAANEFFNHLISLPTRELTKFSTAEWARLVTVIHNVSTSLSTATSQPELIPTIRLYARQISVNLECLANRMGQLSQSGCNPGEFPDMLFLFKSVLDLLLPLEAKIGLPAEDEHDGNATKTLFKAGQCPALVGLRQTDFWTAYRNFSVDVPSYDLGIDLEGLFGDGSGIELSQDEWMDAACSLNM